MELFVVLACHLPLQELEWNFRCVCDTNCLTKLLTSCSNKSSFRSATKRYSFHNIIKKDKKITTSCFRLFKTSLSFPTSSQVPQKEGRATVFIFNFLISLKDLDKKAIFCFKKNVFRPSGHLFLTFAPKTSWLKTFLQDLGDFSLKIWFRKSTTHRLPQGLQLKQERSLFNAEPKTP